MGLDAGHDADRERRLARECAHGGGHRPGRDTRQVAQERAAVQTPRPQALGDGEHDLAVRHWREERLLQPQRPERQPLGVTARTEVAALAREGEQVLVGARGAAHARETVVEDAARKELVGHFPHDGAPGAVRGREALVVDGFQRAKVVLDEPIQRGGLRAPGPVPTDLPNAGAIRRPRSPRLHRRRSAHAERPGCTGRTRGVSPRGCRDHRPNAAARGCVTGLASESRVLGAAGRSIFPTSRVVGAGR